MGYSARVVVEAAVTTFLSLLPGVLATIDYGDNEESEKTPSSRQREKK